MFVAGCSLSSGGGEGPDAEPDAVAITDDAPACALGSLSGIWRARYQVLDGDCGPKQDELVMPTGTLFVEDGCAVAESIVASDACAQHVDFTCPVDGGDMRAVGDFTQIDATHVEWFAVLTYPTCAGTYGARLTKIRD